MEDDIKRILQDKQEIIQNVLERKDSMAVLPTGFEKSMCYILPPLNLDKVRSYMQIISHDTLR
jgi:superfamily II DNA helicase RecQ